MFYNSLEQFLDKIRSGKVATGCVVTFADPTVTEIAAESGFDFCWIDGEHGQMDRNTAMMHIMALKGTGCAPLYRVPACDHTEIKKIIDFAPAGIIVPMILNADDAAKAVAACRYPLTGNRGCGFRRGNRYGNIDMQKYYEMSQREPLVILQIEHIEAVKNLDAILAVEGIDSLLIGGNVSAVFIFLHGDVKDSFAHILEADTVLRADELGRLLEVEFERTFWQRGLAHGARLLFVELENAALAE